MMPRIHIGDQEYPPIYEPLVVAPLLLRDVVFVRLELVGENVSGSVPFWYKTRTYHKHHINMPPLKMTASTLVRTA